jgi:hypothetical protein
MKLRSCQKLAFRFVRTPTISQWAALRLRTISSTDLMGNDELSSATGERRTAHLAREEPIAVRLSHLQLEVRSRSGFHRASRRRD